jgi:hypothetical protein
MSIIMTASIHPWPELTTRTEHVRVLQRVCGQREWTLRSRDDTDTDRVWRKGDPCTGT